VNALQATYILEARCTLHEAPTLRQVCYVLPSHLDKLHIHLNLGGLVAMKFYKPSCSFKAIESLHVCGIFPVPCDQDGQALRCMQELWNLMLMLTALTSGAAQEGLFGIIMVTIIQALSPSSEVHLSVAEAAHSIFMEDLQSPSFAPLLPRVLPRLRNVEKATLREGLQRMSAMEAVKLAAHTRPGVTVGSVIQTTQSPHIDFAAFQSG
jgi:hypothetical protein